MSSKSGRKRAELRGESAGARELAGVLRDIADSHGRALRDLEKRMPYSRTTISERLNSESRPSWEFVVQFLEACTGSDRRAMTVLEGKVRPLWEAAAPRRMRQPPGVPAASGQLPADIGDWVTTMRETAAAQQVMAKLQLSASRSIAIVQFLTDMLARLTAAAQILAEERDALRRELVTRPDTANELLRTRVLLEDTQHRLEAAEQLLAQTARRLDEASRQRMEAERLKDRASLQAASARRRLAAIEQHAVAFAEQVRAGNEMDSEDTVLIGGLDQSVAAEVLSRVDDELGAGASNLDQLQGELASASGPVVRLSAGRADNASSGDCGNLPDLAGEQYRALVQGGAQVIWVAAPNGEMLEDSAEWRGITGQSVEEFLGTGWLGSIHPEDRERGEREWRESLRSGRIFDDRFRIRTQGGSRHYYVRAVPVERDGKIAEWVGACTDVTRVERAAMVAVQRSQLPDWLPRVPGLSIEAKYLPRSTEVGGDWFDVFWLTDRRLAVVVGDVMGRGLIAAAGMGRVRSALRALALTDPRPAAVLTGLDRLFTATDREEQVATVAYLVIDPETGEGQAGNAGHPPTLLLTPGALPVLDGAEAGTPLGWPSPRRQYAFRLSPGSAAVFYSDGLVHSRMRSLDVGLGELVCVAAGAPQDLLDSPGLLLEYLIDNMLAGQEQDDDVTMLIVSRPN